MGDDTNTNTNTPNTMTPDTCTEDEDYYKEAKDFPKTAFVVPLDRFLSVRDELISCRRKLGMERDNHLALQNKSDLWRDEFLRIKALCFGKSLDFLGIESICNRALDELVSKRSRIYLEGKHQHPKSMTSEQPTPETDAAEVKVTEQNIWMNTSFVPSNIARKLEVERNEALDQLASETDRSRELWDFNQKILNEMFDLQVKLINLQDLSKTKDDEPSL